jgi:hypothetical protein
MTKCVAIVLTLSALSNSHVLKINRSHKRPLAFDDLQVRGGADPEMQSRSLNRWLADVYYRHHDLQSRVVRRRF